MEIVYMSVLGKTRAAVELALARAGCTVDVKIVEQPRGLRFRGWGKIVMSDGMPPASEPKGKADEPRAKDPRFMGDGECPHCHAPLVCVP